MKLPSNGRVQFNTSKSYCKIEVKKDTSVGNILGNI